MTKGNENDSPGLSRRSFSEGAGLAGLLSVLGLPGHARAAQTAGIAGPNAMHPVLRGPDTFFTADEATFVRAAVARLIPAEGNGPGAIEADVPNFLDKQLGGAWGQGERLFMGGPFDPHAIPELGYQLPYAPAEMFRRAITAINTHCKAAGTPFAAMQPEQQDRFLEQQLEAGGLGELDGVPASLFFAHLLDITVQGYFSDPVYGGNKDMVSWKAIGFPGAYDAYRNTVGRHGERFALGPFSLAEHGEIPAVSMNEMEKQR